MCKHDFIFQQYDGGMPNLLAPRICKSCRKTEEVILTEERRALDSELRQVYKTLGHMCELSDIVCSWIEKQNSVYPPDVVRAAVKEIMQYVEQVRP